jgi:hypothetical protein
MRSAALVWWWQAPSGEDDDLAAGEVPETVQTNLGPGAGRGREGSEASQRSWEEPAARSSRKEGGGGVGQGSGNSREIRMPPRSGLIALLSPLIDGLWVKTWG